VGRAATPHDGRHCCDRAPDRRHDPRLAMATGPPMVVGDPFRPVLGDLPSDVCVVLDHDYSLRNRSFDEARPHGNRTAKDSVQYATWIVVVSAARARAASRMLFG
jgi:hypothetical protein